MTIAMRRVLPVFALALATGSGIYGQVTITKVTSNPTPTAGGAAFSYTVTVTNNGALGSLVVDDPMPPGVNFFNIAAVGTPLTCVGPAVGTNGNVLCSNPAYPAGGSTTITIVSAIAPNQPTGVRTNTAHVVSGVNQFSASVQQNIVNDANLALSMTATPQALPGGDVAYSIAVQNTGSSSGLNVTVTNPLPGADRNNATATFGSVFGTGPFHNACSFRPATKEVVCFAKEVPAGTEYITLVVKAPPNPTNYTLKNSATMQAGVGIVVGSPAVASTTVYPF